MAPYASPKRFWQFAISRNSMFQETDFAPGFISALTKTGTGTGSLRVGPRSNPIDAFNMLVIVAVAGEINVTNVINPGPLPQIKISMDNGVTFLTTREVSQDENVAYINVPEAGLRLEFRNGTVPSFVLADQWTFTTQPSPDVLDQLEAQSRFCDSFLADVYRLPLLTVPPDLEWVVCELTRWVLLKRKGLNPGQDYKVYEPKEAMKWLANVRDGHHRPLITETPPPVEFPTLVEPIIPLSWENHVFPI